MVSGDCIRAFLYAMTFTSLYGAFIFIPNHEGFQEHHFLPRSQRSTMRQSATFLPGKGEWTLQPKEQLVDKLTRILDGLGENENRPILNVVEYSPTEKIPIDAITVAVHGGANRLNRILFNVRRWGGPVSLALYMESPTDIETAVNFLNSNAYDFRKCNVHFLLENTRASYPHNILRQMALSAIKSDYFLTLDADFVTRPDAATSMLALIRRDENLRASLQNRTFMVIAGFDRPLPNKTTEENVFQTFKRFRLPETKEEAMLMWDQDVISPFHLNRHPVGHAPTDFDRWYDGGITENISTFDDSFYYIEYEHRFEPYVLGYTRDEELPRYWQGFRGYGFNKYTWLIEAYYAGYKFGVLLDEFVIHLDHAYGKRKLVGPTRSQMERFRRYMQTKYGITRARARFI